MLSSLLLIPITNIDLHEDHELTRLQLVHDSIIRQGFLRHPLLAIEMNNGRYLLIDGAHRYQALRKAGCTHVPIQILNEKDVQLSTWLHQVKADSWFNKLHVHPDFELCPTAEKGWLASILNQDGVKQYLLLKNKKINFFESLTYWHMIVNSYSKKLPVYRLPLQTEQAVPLDHVRLCYPKLTLRKIETVVSMGRVLPAGTTQFIVQKRLLNLCIPLRFLFDNEDKAEWNELRTYWSSAIRYYPGSVYMVDSDKI